VWGGGILPTEGGFPRDFLGLWLLKCMVSFDAYSYSLAACLLPTLTYKMTIADYPMFRQAVCYRHNLPNDKVKEISLGPPPSSLKQIKCEHDCTVC